MNPFGYLFGSVAAPNIQDSARRATLAQFQGYPANEIEGAGTLVSQNGGVSGGKYWKINQPPQIYANLVPVLSDLLGGGTTVGTLYGAALAKNNDSIGV